jgi:hypothetical protein
LQAEEPEVEPAPRARPHRAEHQHREQQHDRDRVKHERPARECVIIDHANHRSRHHSHHEPDELPEPELIVECPRAGGIACGRGAEDEREAQAHESHQAEQLQLVDSRMTFVKDVLEHVSICRSQ